MNIMKKRIWCVFVMMIVFAGLITGCRESEIEQEENSGVTKIIWQSEQQMHLREDYFNQVLEEKGYPYEVEFVTSKTVQDGQTVDLLETGISSWAEPYDTAKAAYDGEIISLEDYFNTEQGQKLKATLPEKVWEAYEIQGETYTVLSVGFIPGKIVYIWDKELAEKYDVQPEEWGIDVWNHKEELLRIQAGEKSEGNGEIVAVDGLLEYANGIPGFTNVLGVLSPIVVRESEEDVKAELLYSTPEFQEILTGIKDLYHAGLCKTADSNVQSAKTFLTVDTLFTSEQAKESSYGEGYWEKYEWKEVWQCPLWELSCVAKEIGITKACENPAEVFAFLCALYEDADLTNALMWGEKGVDYDVNGDTAGRVGRAWEYLPCIYAGNQLIGYAEVGQDPNKESVYKEALEEMEVSKVSGFRFVSTGLETELEACVQIEANLLEEYDETIQKYKEAGIDKIIDAWNEQFQQWKSNN